MFETLRDKFRSEWSKLRDMTWRKRFGYIKDYYTATFVVVLLIVVTIVAFVQGWQNKKKDVFLNCAVLEYTGVYSGLEQAGEEYLARLGETGEEARIIVFDDSDVTMRGLETGHDFQKFQGVSAQLSVGDIDIMFLTEEMLKFLQVNRDSYFLPLSDVYTAEELERLGELVLEIADENGEAYPVAIDVSNWQALDGRVTEGIPLYAVIVAGGTHGEHAAEFLKEMSGGYK